MHDIFSRTQHSKAYNGAIARAIAKNIRPSDMPCRYGGEEFAIVLPEASRDCAVERAEPMRAAIRDINLNHLGQVLPAPSASFGVAGADAHGATAVTLLKAADEALYRAKRERRDRVCAGIHIEPVTV